MRITLRILLALVATGLSPLAPAMSLGEGQILSRVGERFSVNIALLGDYDKNVRFDQVRNAECRSSIIGKIPNGCDSLYEGQLAFLIKRRADGQYYLRIEGGRSDELFYRIIIKSKLSASGAVYNAFEFLPEFKLNPDEASAGSTDGEVTIDNSMPSGKYGVVMDKIIEVLPEDAPREDIQSPAKKAAEPAPPKVVIAEAPDEIKSDAKKERKRIHHEAAVSQMAEAKPAVKKSAVSRLQIKKYGENSDNIYTLQKENEEIEQQIILLEKQIGLLKEVARLKNQIGASSIPETAVAPVVAAPESARPVPAPVTVPVTVKAQSAPQQNESSNNLLAWVLLGVAVLLSALLAFLYRRQKTLQAGLSGFTPPILRSSSHADGRESLDLTGSFEQKRL